MTDANQAWTPEDAIRRIGEPAPLASLHFIAACGTPSSYAEFDANPNPLREAVSAWVLDDGAAVLGDAPGIGVEPDLARLAEFRVAW